MTKRITSSITLLLIIFLLITPLTVSAQTYSFSLDKEIVNAYWNKDGTLSIDYQFTFANDASASPIDYVDVGVPNSSYNINNVTADVNGQSLTDISPSPYVKPGVAIGLGSNAIQPGNTGTVHVTIQSISRVLHQDSQDK